MDDFRGKLLGILSREMDGQELRKVSDALNIAMIGFTFKQEETLPVVYDVELAYAQEYLVRKKAKGLSDKTLENYRFVIETFCIGVGKDLKDVSDYDVIRFLDEFERIRGV